MRSRGRMKNKDKTGKHLIHKLVQLRQRIAKLEKSEKTHKQKMRTALLEMKVRYATLVNTSPDAVTLSDLNGKIIDVSQRTLDLHSFKSSKELIGRSAFNLIAPIDHKRAIANLKKTLRENFVRDLEYLFLKKDGSSFIGELSAALIRDAHGRPKAFLATTRDITERKKAEQGLRENEEKYRTLTENINVGVYRNTPGPKGKFIEANPAFIEMFGYKSKEQIFGINVADLYQKPEDRKKFNEKMLTDGFVRNEELYLKKKDGSLIVCSVSAVAIKDEKGKVKYYDGIIENITDRKRAEEELKRLATTDPLTELLNRGSGLLFLNKYVQLAKRQNFKLSICYLDINNLKAINDNYGHKEGDEVLKLVSKFIKATIRISDAACRLGGDEFLIIFPQCAVAQAVGIGQRIVKKLAAYNKRCIKPYTVSLSYGFAEYGPGRKKTIDQLLTVADQEMYKQKHAKLKHL
jgi:diguanylate cyclase (GGDEF)-like protein/PAS domain S-box-containing protein